MARKKISENQAGLFSAEELKGVNFIEEVMEECPSAPEYQFPDEPDLRDPEVYVQLGSDAHEGAGSDEPILRRRGRRRTGRAKSDNPIQLYILFRKYLQNKDIDVKPPEALSDLRNIVSGFYTFLNDLGDRGRGSLPVQEAGFNRLYGVAKNLFRKAGDAYRHLDTDELRVMDALHYAHKMKGRADDESLAERVCIRIEDVRGDVSGIVRDAAMQVLGIEMYFGGQSGDDNN